MLRPAINSNISIRVIENFLLKYEEVKNMPLPVTTAAFGQSTHWQKALAVKSTKANSKVSTGKPFITARSSFF